MRLQLAGRTVADLTPRRARQPDPHQDQNCAQEQGGQIAREDDEHREDAERPESSQACGETVVG
ncbi:MAG: hypothetical protein ACREEM_00185 [Blastocatellia bacterium]